MFVSLYFVPYTVSSFLEISTNFHVLKKILKAQHNVFICMFLLQIYFFLNIPSQILFSQKAQYYVFLWRISLYTFFRYRHFISKKKKNDNAFSRHISLQTFNFLKISHITLFCYIFRYVHFFVTEISFSHFFLESERQGKNQKLSINFQIWKKVVWKRFRLQYIQLNS